ncbi:MAG TPA: aminoacetone oxidase family FAD-binding enzyme [Vicinamibacterales bacterium]|jgi:hypothetical protein
MDVAIVGAGAAGLATAIFAARQKPGARIVVFDGARRLGAKLLVSGGGRCNLTNRAVTAADFWGGNRRVIDSVLRAFPVSRAVAFFAELGVDLHEEEDGKLFPDSNRARTVLDALLAEAARLDVDIRLQHRVDRLVRDDDAFVLTAKGTTGRARRVVLATGGLSLPKTGSDGGGLALAASCGHTIVPTTPALVPLVLGGEFHRALSGVSHQATLTVHVEGRRPTRLAGPLLWTHFGVSGPVALDASRHWHRAMVDRMPATVRLSFAADRDFQTVEQALLQAAGQRPNCTIRGAVAALVPGAVAEALLAALTLDGRSRMAHLPREDRRRLVHAIVEWDLPVTGSRGYNYAEVTAGGVSLDEVDRATLESKICPGLFLVGEMLDVDGRLGGFNFQWAWSSAWAAARAAAR